MATRYLMSELYCAFNPATELRSPAGFYDRDSSDGELSKQELIIQGSMVNKMLEREMPDLQYRMLRLLFKKQEFDQAGIDLDVVRPVLIKDARIYGDVDRQFVNICIINECWKTDLFRTREYGPMKRYAVSTRPETLSRRRRRLAEAVNGIRLAALARAEVVIANQSDE